MVILKLFTLYILYDIKAHHLSQKVQNLTFKVNGTFNKSKRGTRMAL